MAALASDGPDAERRFSANLSAKVPPPVLRMVWRSLLAKNGPLRRFSIVHTDSDYGKRRYGVELDFTERKLMALVVFEPASGEVIGLFFVPAPELGPPAAASSENAEPDVAEIALNVGAPPNVLGATLALPRARGDARLPAVLMIAGSGPSDRDETLQRAKPFRDIARGLARRGIVTLRFDKRPLVYPAQFERPGITVEDEVIADAVAALGTLRARPEVDPERVYVLGHSLGGFIAPDVAKRGGKLAGLVLIAAGGGALAQNALEQLRLGGEPAAELASLEKQVKALPSLPPDERVLGVRASYWQDLERRDEPRTARALGVKVLYLRGELDRNVFAADQEKWQRAFAGDPRFESVTLPGLNHLLTPAHVALSNDVHVPDDVIAKMAGFVLAP